MSIRVMPMLRLDPEHEFIQSIRSCHGVVDLCRIVSELSRRKDIKKTDCSILQEFMNRSDWFAHTGTKTENGAIAVAKFFAWWATDNPNAGFWLCSHWYKDRVVAAFVTAMKNGQVTSITDTIRKLLCTGYAPLFDMLNTPEITSRMDSSSTKNVLRVGRPRSDTDKKVDRLELFLPDVESDTEELREELDDVKSELDQMTRERAAEKAEMQRQVTDLQFDLDQIKRERAAEKQQRAVEKIDHEKTKELLERALKEMKAMEIHFLKRESGHRRNREEHDKFSVKEEWQ